MKKLLFLTLVFTISCHEKTPTKVEQKIDEKQLSHATIIIENNTDFPIALRREPHYKNINKDLYVSEKRKDTFHVDLSIPEFVFLSHKNILGDTILIGNMDTLRVRFGKEDIFIERESKLDHDDKFQKVLGKFQTDSLIALLTGQKDSLTLFFRKTLKTGKPLVGKNEYQLFTSYPIDVYRKEYPSRVDEEITLITTLTEIYKKKVGFVNSDEELSDGLKKTLNYRFQKEFYHELMFLVNLFNSPRAKKTLDSEIFINDSLLCNPYSKAILLSYLNRNVIKSKSENSRSKQYINYLEAYDNVPKYLNDSLSKWARFLSIESMVNYEEKFDAILDAYSSFKTIYQDSVLNGYLESNYLFDLKRFTNISTEIMLVDKNHKVISFQDVLKQLEGNIVYVDFWASWCAPCRDAIPYSTVLIDNYANSDFTYIYLSIDKHFDRWELANRDEHIEGYTHNYLILNPEQADFLKDIALDLIPRYILFDKKGQLIHQSAPGPKGKNILELLDNELGKIEL